MRIYILQKYLMGSLSPTMLQAVILVLLKKVKKPILCDSYRPVSLVCCDYKILAKVLALYLETLLHQIIHPDQTGCIREGSLLGIFTDNVIYSNTGPNSKIVVSLGTQKAFDRIEFDDLLTALCQFGFSSSFISWIKVLYSAPQAAFLNI